MNTNHLFARPLKHYSIDLEQDTLLQYVVGFLCLLVYSGSLFFPLMDKDAAHHANIALHMLEHNDYVSLVDRGMDYLDKPHFLFWTSALSFKIFGVNTFGHRFPAILFGLVSIWSVYKLTRHLSNKTTAKLAALMLATAQGFILSITDARMETPLAAAIIFGLWHLVVYIDTKKSGHLFLAALGAAIAFSTKGWIGVVIIFMAAFFYILLNKRWSILLRPLTWLFIPFFILFITPVLYAYYLQYDLHPEKMIRGMDHISGVKFILWDQNFERFKGDSFNKGGRNSSVFFLYHTFLWAFFPWCIAAYAALIWFFRRMFWKKKWKYAFNFAALAFGSILFTISFSKFKMPHYIFMLMPLAALFTAPFLRMILSYKAGTRFFYPLHVVIAILLIVLTIVLNFWFFPASNLFFPGIAVPMIVGLVSLLLFPRSVSRPYRFFGITAAFMILFNFCLNFNFFPGLFHYQGGNELVKEIHDKGLKIDDRDILLLDNNAHSFDFYRNYNHPVFNVAALPGSLDSLKDKIFLVNSEIARQLITRGYKLDTVVSRPDYNVSTMKLKFLNPSTRQSKVDTLMLARISR